MTKPKALTHRDAHVRARDAFMEAWFAARTEWDGDCLLWTGTLIGNKAPHTHVFRQSVQVRKFYFEWKHKRVVEDGYRMVCVCSNPRCLVHAEPMHERGEYQRWLAASGRMHTPKAAAQRKRAGMANAVHSMETARLVRQLRAEGLSYGQIEKRTGMGKALVQRVCVGKAWREHFSQASVFTLAGAPGRIAA